MAAISVEDRLAIEDLYADYVWALDSGDVPGFLTLFTADGVFGDTAGNRYTGHAAIRGYVTDSSRRRPSGPHALHQRQRFTAGRRPHRRHQLLAGHQVGQGDRRQDR